MQPAPDAFDSGKIGMERFRVAAKANPWYKDPKTYDFVTPTYGLKPDLVKEQLRTSIKVLGYVEHGNDLTESMLFCRVPLISRLL